MKNEGLFNAVEIIIPENTIAHPPPNKPAALGSFHPACEITEAVCVALSQVAPERSAPQVYKIGMPNAVIGFKNGQMWMDQGVDTRTMDVSAVQGIDGWGSCPVALGNLLLSEAEDAREPFSRHQYQPRNDHRLRRGGALARSTRQPQREEGSGADHGHGLDGIGSASAPRHVRRR